MLTLDLNSFQQVCRLVDESLPSLSKCRIRVVFVYKYTSVRYSFRDLVLQPEACRSILPFFLPRQGTTIRFVQRVQTVYCNNT